LHLLRMTLLHATLHRFLFKSELNPSFFFCFESCPQVNRTLFHRAVTCSNLIQGRPRDVGRSQAFLQSAPQVSTLIQIAVLACKSLLSYRSLSCLWKRRVDASWLRSGNHLVVWGSQLRLASGLMVVYGPLSVERFRESRSCEFNQGMKALIIRNDYNQKCAID